MKSIKKATSLKSKIISLAICIALICCAIFSFGAIAPRGAFADDGPDISQKTENGIRFVQVAAGYDFAIGLTYDGDLYGWSLKPNRSTPAATLGDYYPADPKKIDVKFRTGPGGGKKLDWSSNSEGADYHATIETDKIAHIAATAHTAAFVTQKGYIYTWGRDDTATTRDITISGNSKPNYLLLRSTEDGVSVKAPWYEPYIIDYGYYNGPDANNVLSDGNMVPSGDKVINTSIAAGEYNYIFMFEYNYQGAPDGSGDRHPDGIGHYYATFVWGSLLYDVPNTDKPQNSHSYSGSLQYSGYALNIYLTPFEISTEQKVSVVAGGYTVGVNGYDNNDVTGGTSLQLRGKNFLTTQNLVATASEETTVYSAVNTAEVVTPAKSTLVSHNKPASGAAPDGPAVGSLTVGGVTVNNAIAGANGDDQEENAIRGFDLERYYARQKGVKTGTGDTATYSSLLYSTDVAPAIWGSSSDADADRLAGDGTTNLNGTVNSMLRPLHYEVSLGNDIGYGISGGNLFAWGDNADNQLTSDVSGGYTSNPVQILESKGTIVSVAAGKQKSTKHAYYTDASYGSSTLDAVAASGTYAYKPEVRNESAFISAALTDRGLLWAWNKDVQPTQVTFCDVDPSSAGTDKREEFAAIYSGYADILFAVTTRGKLVQITSTGDRDHPFALKVYDKFYDEKGVAIVNWDIDDGNDVVFKSAKPTADDPVPEFGVATFYVWSATALKGSEADETILINNSTAAAYKPLIQHNRIGDAYRIVGKDASDANLQYKLLGDGETDLDKDTYLPVFKFDGNDMTDAQQENMFEYAVVYDAARGVGISIHPLQSTKGKKITIELNIARYNTYTKYGGSTATDKAIYYDHKVCKITFSVEDTDTVKHYSAFDAENGGNCRIPLLDPNNEYNKYFSLAVQDVTSGADALNAFLTSESEAVDPGVKSAILAQMKEKDKGFPDTAKIEKGNLNYYLNSADLSRYDDTYEYLFTDRDSDFIQISLPSSGSIISGNNGVSGEIVNITVRTEVTLRDSLLALAKDQTAAEIAKINKAISTDFDNKYGLYNIAYSVSGEKTYISFTYDVVTFTGSGSSGVIEYDEKSNSVTSYSTTIDSSAAREANIVVNTIVNYNYSATEGYVADKDKDKYKEVNGEAFASVCSNPSLRLKPDVKSPDELVDVNGISDDNPLYKGDSAPKRSGTNSYTTINSTQIYVGETRTIYLSSFFNEVGANISFSFNNSAAQDKLNDFSKQFADDTGHGMDVVKLYGDRIEIHPTTAVQLNFTVEVQRFTTSAKTQPFVSGTVNGDPIIEEKIYLTFRYTSIEGFRLVESATAKTEYLVTGATKIDIFGEGDGVANAATPFVTITDSRGVSVSNEALTVLKRDTKIYNASNTEQNKKDSDKLFTCNNPDNKTLVINPLRSGTGYVQFTVNVYNQSVSVTLTINVSKETTLNNDHLVTVIEDKYVYVSDLLLELEKSNSFNPDVKAGKYKVLYGDVKNPTAAATERIYNAIYFTDNKNTVGTPSFIRNAVFENVTGDADIRIISSNTSTQQSETYYMHVRFTSDSEAETYDGAKAGSIIEMIVPVVSGKIKLQDTSAGGDLHAKIDCRHEPAATNWWKTEGSGLDTRVTIDLATLLESAQIEHPDKYMIFLLSSDSEASTFFTYSKADGDRTIVITPSDNTPLLKDNTRKIYELNVSIFREDDVTDTKVLSFEVSVDGIVDRLPVMTDDGLMGYGNIWLYSFLIVFGVLFIIFVIRFIVYIRRRAKQRAIIKRNQELIRMRDRMHGKANAASREQLVRAKMKMEDPKYAKMFNDLRRDKEDESGISLDNSDLAQAAEAKSKKKKKGGKKSVAELKAELEAKKAAFAAAQAQNAQPVNPFVSEVPIDGGDFGAPVDGGFGGDSGFADGGFGGGAEFADAEPIIFDASDIGDGNM